MTMLLSSDIWSVVPAVRQSQEFQELFSDMVSVASILAACCTAWSVIRTFSTYVEGQGLSMWTLLRPVVILLCVTQFDLVGNAISQVTGIFTRDMAAYVELDFTEFTEKWSELMSRQSELSQAAIAGDMVDNLPKEDDPLWKRLYGYIKSCTIFMLGQGQTSLHAGVETVVSGLLMLVMKLLMYGQQILCNVYLLICLLLAPYVFALAILPSFSGGITHWIARYVQISLWIPIGFLVMKFNLVMANAYLESVNASDGFLNVLADQYIVIVYQIVIIVSVASVPKIAGWVIESTGTNEAHGNISSMGRRLISAASGGKL